MTGGMFIRPDGTHISEDVHLDKTSRVHWVTVDFRRFSGRIADCGGDALMRLMAKQIRARVVSISSEPKHHANPGCLSLPVVADPRLPLAQVLDAAAEIADWHVNEITSGRETLDYQGIGDSLRRTAPINGR